MAFGVKQGRAPEVVAQKIPGSCSTSGSPTSASGTAASGDVMITGDGAQIIVNELSIQRVEIDAGGQDDRNSAHPAIPRSIRSFHRIRTAVAASASLGLPRRTHGNAAKDPQSRLRNHVRIGRNLFIRTNETNDVIRHRHVTFNPFSFLILLLL